MPRFVKVATLAQLPAGGVLSAEAGGIRLALYRVDDRVYATAGACPHRGGPLAEGTLEGTSIVCPWHAFRFDVATGLCAGTPTLRVACHPVRVEGQEILVEV